MVSSDSRIAPSVINHPQVGVTAYASRNVAQSAGGSKQEAVTEKELPRTIGLKIGADFFYCLLPAAFCLLNSDEPVEQGFGDGFRAGMDLQFVVDGADVK